MNQTDSAPTNPQDDGIEMPATLYLRILEIALKTGKTEEQVLGGLMESFFNLTDSPGETELKGFALEAREALRRCENEEYE